MPDVSACTDPHPRQDQTPEWFRDAIRDEGERFSVRVDGANIDCRAWGRVGNPGLVLLHGNAGHLGWWSFLAPLFAPDCRVIALSFGGTGASDWRPRYSVDLFVEESLAAAEAGGANLVGPPVYVGHSLGGFPVLRIAARFPERVHAAAIVDTALPKPDSVVIPPSPTAKIYSDDAAAMARFRLSPPQPMSNEFILKYIAQRGLKPVEGGCTWSFDRTMWGNVERGDFESDLAGAKVPLAILRGGLSQISAGNTERRYRELAPANTQFIEIPDAHHHVMIDQPLATVTAIRTLLSVWLQSRQPGTSPR